MECPRQLRRNVPAALLAAGLVLAPATAARAGDRVVEATAAAEAAADRVAALAQRSTLRAGAVRHAVAALAGSFNASTESERRSAAAAATLRVRRSEQATRVRALYAGGGAAGLVASVLDAGSVDDALWRASTADRVLGDVLAGDRREQAVAATVAAGAARDERRAAALDARRVQALQGVQRQAARADAALAAAQDELDRLSTRARRLRAAVRAAEQLAAARAALAEARSGGGPISMSAGYRRSYRAAARTCPGMRWTLLAAVGQVESGHGRNPGPSSAGAIGPMQFMPATFASYGVDGDHDGRTDAWDPEDSIFSAARYLCASGAGDGSDRDVHDALLTYNHAEWYVQLVLDAEAGIIAGQ